MDNFDRELCINNIRYLMKKKDIKVQDLEDNAGVSKGYLSRLSSDNAKAIPAINVIASFARTLGVTVDALIGYDFSGLTETDQKVVFFLDKLVNDTVNFQQTWTRESYEELYRYLTYGSQIPEELDSSHPLFHVENTSPMGGGGYPEDYYMLKYSSLFHIYKDIDIWDDCYVLNINNDTHLYLMKIHYGKIEQTLDGDIFPNNAPEDIELYIVSNSRVSSICNASNDADKRPTIFSDQLYRLYDAAKETTSHAILAPEALDFINTYVENKKGSTKKGGNE